MITYSTNTTYTVHVNKNCFGFMLLPYFTQIYLSYLGLWQGWLYTCVYEDVLMKYFTNCVSSYNWYFGDLFLFSTTLHIPKGCANWRQLEVTFTCILFHARSISRTTCFRHVRSFVGANHTYGCAVCFLLWLTGAYQAQMLKEPKSC